MPKKIQDALGQVELKGTPKRVVALEWTYAEEALAVGVQPIGVAIVVYSRLRCFLEPRC